MATVIVNGQKKAHVREGLASVITGSIEFDLDGNVTVLLGADDHGKSNILKGLCCLNQDTSISNDYVNWDATNPARLRFEFAISNEEVSKLSEAIQSTRSMDDSSTPGAVMANT